MRKRWLSLGLCMAMILSQAVPAMGEETAEAEVLLMDEETAETEGGIPSVSDGEPDSYSDDYAEAGEEGLCIKDEGFWDGLIEDVGEDIVDIENNAQPNPDAEKFLAGENSIIESTVSLAASGNLYICGVDMEIAAGSYMQFSTSSGASSDSGYYYNGYYLAASQCFGFARWCQYKLFGYNSGSSSSKFYKVSVNGVGDDIAAGSLTTSNLKSMITAAKPEAHLRTHANSSGVAHSMIITAISDSGFSIAQCNGSNNNEYSSWKHNYVGTYAYTWSSYLNSTYGPRGIDYIELPVDYPYSNESPSTYVNLGSDFFAYIINTSRWQLLTEEKNGNVRLSQETGDWEQIWHFEYQSNGSYKITSLNTGHSLDVDNFGTVNGTNVKTEIYNGSAAQRWYISGESGSFRLSSACSETMVLDADSGTGNIWMWESNDTDPQKFTIYQLNNKLGESFPLNVGNDFYAFIENQTTGDYLTNINNDVRGERPTGEENQIWHFVRNNNGTYRIISFNDNRVMDVFGESDDNGANVYTWEEYVDGFNQQFYIYYRYGAYNIKPRNTSNKVLDLDTASKNLQIYDAAIDYYHEPQSFNIKKIDLNGCVPSNLGDDFYAFIEHQSTGLYLTNQQNNIAGEKPMGNSSQIWHFIRNKDGSYRILSELDNSCMDVYGPYDKDDTNVYTWSPYLGGANQNFYLYYRYDAYYIMPTHSTSRVLDMAGSAENYNLDVRRHIVGGANRTLISVKTPSRSCRIGT